MSENRGDAEERGDSLDPYRYRMDYQSIGTCVIINNRNFPDMKGQETRDGTNADAEAVERTFQGLGYKIRRADNLTAGKMVNLLCTVSQEDHRNSASFVCVLMSYGGNGTIYGTDHFVEVRALTEIFCGDRCKTLVAKPKLFFIQASRGAAMDFGSQTDYDDASDKLKIPVEADFLYAYSTAPGYTAWRNTINGSWFMQTLCEMLKKHSNQELMHIMTRVNNKVALEFEAATTNPEVFIKQIPCIVTMLTKDFYFC